MARFSIYALFIGLIKLVIRKVSNPVCVLEIELFEFVLLSQCNELLLATSRTARFETRDCRCKVEDFQTTRVSRRTLKVED